MEQLLTLKPKLRKVTIFFLVFLLGCTFVSRSIYEYLLPVVQTANVKGGSLEDKYMTHGKVGLNEEVLKNQQALISSFIDGRVTEVFIEEGQQVKKGEPLCTVQKVNYEMEQGSKAIEEAELTMNASSLARQIESKEEKKQQIEESYRLKEQELAKVKNNSRLMTLNEQIKEQKQLVVTNEALEAEGLIAKNECEQEKTKLASLERSLIEETQAIEEGLKQNITDLQTQRTEVDLSLADLRAAQQLNAQKKALLQETVFSKTLESPIDGYVYRLNIAKGAYVQAQETLLIVLPDNIAYGLSFEAPEQVAEKVQMQQKVHFTYNQKSYEARINKKKFKEENGQYVLLAEIDEKLLRQMQLEPTSYKMVSVSVESRSGEYQMIVDQSAIKRVYSNAYVFVVEESTGIGKKVYRVREVPITILEESDYKAAISGQLGSNTKIVRGNIGNLQDGQEVALK